MIRSIRKTPLIRLSFQAFVFSIYLISRSHGQEEPNTGFVREKHVNELKRELIQIKKDLQTLQPNNERLAVDPPLSSTIPDVSSKKISQNPPALKRATAIIEVKDDLHLIRQGLLKLKAEKTTEPSKQKISLESNFPVRSIVKVRQRSDYFLFINPGIAFAQDREYSPLASPYKSLLETRAGLELSIAFGGQIGPWTIGPEIGYRRLGYKSFSTPSLAFNTKTETGNSTSYFFALYSGRDIALLHPLNLNVGISLGVANMNETFTLLPGSSHNPTEEGSRFQGSVRAALEYRFTDLCSAHLGYKFSYVDDLGDFGSLLVHQAELGLRLNL